MQKNEIAKRLVILQLNLLLIAIQGGTFAYIWYQYYAEGIKVFFWGRGHWAVIGLYVLMLLLFSNIYGGMKLGRAKATEILLSQLFSGICAAFFSYMQTSLLWAWFAPVKPFLLMFAIQAVLIVLWAFFSDLFYRAIFPPERLLFIHGERPVDEIIEKFGKLRERFHIAKSVTEQLSKDELIEIISEGVYDGVILWDIEPKLRNGLLKYCYGQSLNVYTMPKISDVIVMSSEHFHIFDTPILKVKNEPLHIEEIFLKRFIDIILSFVLFIITLPFALMTAIAVKMCDGGPILFKQVRCTKNNRRFTMIKFRSMRVDAEDDGVARLAAERDSRITPVGRIIRAIRFDELPQLLNILKGDMSFIGPRPERPEIIETYIKEMPEFSYRTKVKAGLAGYAQVFGKYNTKPYDKLKLDLFYIENYSLWLDIKLLFLTVKVLFMPDSTEGIAEQQVTALPEDFDDD